MKTILIAVLFSFVLLGASTRAASTSSVDVVISSLKVVQGKKVNSYEIFGTANADQFKRAWVTIGIGEDPEQWKRVGTKLKKPVVEDSLMSIPATEFTELGLWQVVLHAEHLDGTVRSFRKPLRLQ